MDSEHLVTLMVLLVGGLVVAAMATKALLERVSLPPLIGFLLLGFGLRVTDSAWPWMSPPAEEMLHLLARLGLICLLFRVGLDSDLGGLLAQLRRASLIWVGGVSVSGGLGFAASYWLLNLGLVPSLFAAAALTATSVGVPVRIWQKRDRLQTPEGALLLDVAEMDDISGILLMAMLFGVAPVLAAEGGSLIGPLVRTTGWVLVKLAGLMVAALLFSRYAEHRFTGAVERWETPPDPMLMVVGVGLVTGAVAGLLGFSAAIGAFLAGLAFSRDPDAIRMEASFDALYELFVPFFFIGIGLSIAPAGLTGALAIGGVLLVVAIAGKLVGHGVVSLGSVGRMPALLIGTSMVPRAEIAMVIMQNGQSMGSWAVPDRLYSGMVLVMAGTCILAPVTLGWLLGRWSGTGDSPQTSAPESGT
ncbi:MAG: cation:proton antiporter [Planctomycetota bacterium]